MKENRKMQEQRDLIHRMIEQTGLSASALAVAAGLAHTTLTRFLDKGTSPLSERTIHKLRQIAPDEAREALERATFLRALAATMSAAGITPDQARVVIAAALSLYRISRATDPMTDAEMDQAARIAVDTAKGMLH